MRSLLVTLTLAALLSSAPIYAKINFGSISGVDLTEAEAFDTKYTNMANSLSKYYGETMAFASHLGAPNARDNLGRFPSLYIGFGLGGAFGKADAFKNETDSSVNDIVPGILLAPNMSFNFGMGINRQWDVRFSFFPGVPISMDPALMGSGTTTEVRLGTYRARVGYHLLEGGFMKPGVTLAGFVSYTSGGMSLEQTGQNISSGNVAIANATSKFSTNWQYIGVGPEIRAWFDMMFFHPFIGYSLGLQVGQFTTGFDINGTVTVNGTPYGAGSLTISEREAAKLYSHRILLGFEISLFFFELGSEVQVDLTTGLVGMSLGTAFRF